MIGPLAETSCGCARSPAQRRSSSAAPVTELERGIAAAVGADMAVTDAAAAAVALQPEDEFSSGPKH